MTSFFTRRQESRWRWLMVPAVLVAAAAHLPVIRPHLDEAPYMGVLFVVLSAACVVLASVAISWDTPVVYALSVLTCGLAVLGYAATRLVAFPMLSDDVGNWFEPLGLVSVASETVVVVAAWAALGRRSSRIGLSPQAA
jgi:hypothetical protein